MSKMSYAFHWLRMEPLSDREGHRDEEPERESQDRQRTILEKLGGLADGLGDLTVETQAERVLPEREA